MIIMLVQRLKLRKAAVGEIIHSTQVWMQIALGARHLQNVCLSVHSLQCVRSVVLWFGGDEYEGLDGSYTLIGGTLRDGDSDTIQHRDLDDSGGAGV